MQQTTEDNNTLVKVEFLCADCKNGKHGCAKLWRGVGLEIGCYCSCTVLRSITLAEGKQLEKEGQHGKILVLGDYVSNLSPLPPPP